MKKYLILITVIFLMYGCDNDPARGPVMSETKSPEPISSVSTNEMESPIDYGNGVYYFPCTGRVFAIALSKFKTDTSIVITSVATDVNGSFSGISNGSEGYFVTVEKRK